ncbi:HD domain-containing protein [Patescibacteria group bacterium]|nr:HD domain-containing protein [Patescibacteria group bacterium]
MLRNNIERKILSEIRNEVQNIFTNPLVDPVHDITHILMVVDNIQQISRGENQDLFVPTLAGWLHDVGRIAEIKAKQEGRNLPHAQASAEQVPLFLGKHRRTLKVETIETIQDAIARHSDLNKPDDSLIAIYLKEADRLAGLGAVGIFRNVAESGLKHRHLINMDNPFPNDPIKPSRFRESDASAIEALLFISEWHEMFRTETGTKLAKPHAEAMARFLWQIAFETGTKIECARNRIIQTLSSDVPDLQAQINPFLI